MMKRGGWGAMAAVVLPPLVLAGLGVTHPPQLTEASARWWTTLHLILLPIFPLLAVSVWVLLRGHHGILDWGARIATVIYVVFYGALDSIAGIADGTVVLADHSTTTPSYEALFAIAKPLGVIGGYSFFVGAVLVLLVAWRAGSRGAAFYVAIPVLLASSTLLASSHIYWPRGVLVMVGVAIGFALVEFSRKRTTGVTS